MKDRRREAREPKRIHLVFWDREDPEDRRTGFTSDTSINGVFVQTNRPLRSGTRIQIEFDRNPGTFLAEGLIVRSISVPPDLRKLKAGGMGVHLLGIDALLSELKAAHDPNRTKSTPASPDEAEPSEPESSEQERVATRPKRRTVFERETPATEAARRHPAAARTSPTGSRGSEVPGETSSDAPTFAIAFRTFDDLRQAYESELRMGGLFVPVESPAEVGKTVSVSLMLPLGRGKIEVTARVVQALPSGMGIAVEDAEGLAADLLEILESE